MEYTTNYHLPQWVETDRIMMGDFNDAMGSIEEGMSSNAEAAEAAQTAASQAYNPNNKPYAIGSYIGQNSDTEVIIGFRPSFVIISGMQNPTSISSTDLSIHSLITAGNTGSGAITFTDTGFIVHKVEKYPSVTNGFTFDFIAFR